MQVDRTSLSRESVEGCYPGHVKIDSNRILGCQRGLSPRTYKVTVNPLPASDLDRIDDFMAQDSSTRAIAFVRRIP